MKFLLILPLLTIPLIPLNEIKNSKINFEPCVLIECKDETGTCYGTGFSFFNNDEEFIWTAAHVVANAKKPNNEFKEVNLIQYLIKDDIKVGEKVLKAEVIRYSDPYTGYDLALLKPKHNITKSGVKFGNKAPEVGDDVYFIGSPTGHPGYNSYIKGILAGKNRGVRGFDHQTNDPILHLDQYSLPITGGASGGPVFNMNNEVIGIIVRAEPNQQTMSWAVPINYIKKFAIHAKCEWAINNSFTADIIYLKNPIVSNPK